MCMDSRLHDRNVQTLAGSESMAYASPIILKSLSVSLWTSSPISFHRLSSPLSLLAKDWPAYINNQCVKRVDHNKHVHKVEHVRNLVRMVSKCSFAICLFNFWCWSRRFNSPAIIIWLVNNFITHILNESSISSSNVMTMTSTTTTNNNNNNNNNNNKEKYNNNKL